MLPYVFCASTGRCGTHTLASLLAQHPQIESYHEVHHPSGTTLFTRDPLQMREAVVARRTSRAGVYVETSHAFIKFAVDAVDWNLSETWGLIQIVRDPFVVAASLAHRGTVPGGVGAHWHLDLTDGSYMGTPCSSWSAYQMFLWEWFECHMRANALSASVPRYVLSFDRLIEGDLDDLLAFVGVTPHTFKVVHQNANCRQSTPRVAEAAAWWRSLTTECRRACRRLLEDLRRRGALPHRLITDDFTED